MIQLPASLYELVDALGVFSAGCEPLGEGVLAVLEYLPHLPRIGLYNLCVEILVRIRGIMIGRVSGSLCLRGSVLHQFSQEPALVPDRNTALVLVFGREPFRFVLFFDKVSGTCPLRHPCLG